MSRKKSETADGKSVDALFEEYLVICNKAIEQHKDDFPYKQILSATEAIMGRRLIDMAVYDDKPKGAFALSFEDSKLERKGDPSDIKKAWRVNLSYLEHVVENPEEYIKHPEKLDLDWLKNRLGF